MFDPMVWWCDIFHGTEGSTMGLLCALKTGSFDVGVFRGIFLAGRRSGRDEGIEVFRRPEGVYSEAGG